LNKDKITEQRRNTNNKKRRLDVSKEDMEKWKEDVLAILNSTQGNHLWMRYIKAKNVKKKPEQWVSELTEDDYEDFTNSKTPLGFWLAKKLRQGTK